jgi:hypothetical protein
MIKKMVALFEHRALVVFSLGCFECPQWFNHDCVCFDV